MIPANSSPTQLIFAIHGVGNPRPGEVKTAVEKNLCDAGLEGPVQEFNWNQRLPYQLSPDTPFEGLGWSRVKSLALRLADACLIDLNQIPPGLAQWTWKAHYASFKITECILAILVSISAIFSPALFLTGPVYDLKFRTDWFLVLLRIVTWTNRTLLISAGFSVFFAIITTIITSIKGDLRPLWIAMRRLVLLILRPGVLVLTLIFLTPIVSILTLGGSLLALYTLLLAPITWGVGIFVLLSSVLLSYVLMILLGPADKVLLDIFLYISDKEHRRHLQEILDAELAPVLAEVSELVLVTHSLGTVLAIDSLLHSKIWTGQETVTLITYGSPLKRFFTRFFPGHILPSSIDECAHRAAARIGRFRWLNGYRPYDEIGTSIGLSDSSWTKEFSTGQPWRWFNHPDYWSDPEVRDKTIIYLRKLSFSEEPRQQSHLSLEPTTALSLSVNYRELITSVIGLSALVIVIAVGLTSLIASIYYLHHTLDANFRDAQRVLKTGAETEATVSYTNRTAIVERPPRPDQLSSKTTQPPSTYTSVFWSLEFEYVAAGKLQRHKLEYSSTEHTFYDLAKLDQWLDWDRLAKFIILTSGQKPKFGTLLDPVSGNKTFYILSGKLAGVSLRYDPILPDRFVLPTFPPAPNIITKCFALIETVMFCLFLTVLYGGLAWCVFIGILLLTGDFFGQKFLISLIR